MSGKIAVARVKVAERRELRDDEVWVAALPKAADGKPRQALIVLDATGRPRAYRNLCRHLPVPMYALHPDATPAAFPHDGHLKCMTHGASYRLHDGLCFTGPCRGSTLHALELEQHDGHVFVLDDGTD